MYKDNNFVKDAKFSFLLSVPLLCLSSLFVLRICLGVVQEGMGNSDLSIVAYTPAIKNYTNLEKRGQKNLVATFLKLFGAIYHHHSPHLTVGISSG